MCALVAFAALLAVGAYFNFRFTQKEEICRHAHFEPHDQGGSALVAFNHYHTQSPPCEPWGGECYVNNNGALDIVPCYTLCVSQLGRYEPVVEGVEYASCEDEAESGGAGNSAAEK